METLPYIGATEDPQNYWAPNLRLDRFGPFGHIEIRINYKLVEFYQESLFEGSPNRWRNNPNFWGIHLTHP
eukprot:1259124-Amphidinium_carterae.1